MNRARLLVLRDTLFFVFGGFAVYNGLSAVPANYFRFGVGAMLIVFGLWEFALRLKRRGL